MDVELYVSTEDDEITVAMGGWHQHIANFGDKTEQEEIQEAIQLIKDIFEDRLIVAFATIGGKWSGSSVIENELDTEPQEGEVLSIRRWSKIN